ncbi:MAG: Tyrosine--tRNA ligase [Alphaproteobacteria bacterium ADurb.Bin438]|nr:MAG: Tyrosine--tRNA ligase [Alphaproteobacteria bacterium ADurb.Bin438]
MKSEILQTLKERGFINQITDEQGLDKKLSEKSVTFYNGYDCTANSLHVGNLLTIMLLRWMQKFGHKPLVLMGGGTSMIGDPSGRDSSRQMMTKEIIASNMAGIKKVFTKYLDFNNGSNKAVMINNADWLLELNYVEFLRDFGKHFTINRMLSYDSVKLRLEREQPLTFLEFNYMLLQGYDFYKIAKDYGCELQTGGSDQWGNIVNGIELARRVDGMELFGLTIPLLTKSSGEKMGKSVNGAIWLNEENLSSYDYWQFWRNTEDADVGRFLRLYTELPISEIEKLEKLEGSEINEAKKVLADEATKLCHGEEKSKEARETAIKAFEEKSSNANLPSVNADFSNPVGILDLLVTANLVKSKGEARRAIQGNGIKVNDETVTDEALMLSKEDFKDGSIKLSMGKKKHILVKEG